MYQLLDNKIIIYTIILILISVWLYPMWYMYNLAVMGDGNILLQRFEAIRQSIIVYGQWPGNNPWNGGGQPLEGSPGRFIFSVKGLLTLFFGAKAGLGISLIIFNAIGYFGSLKLAKIFWRGEYFNHIFALLVISNSAVLFHLSAGHFIFLNYYLLPLIFYYFFRFDKDKWSGVKVGILIGIAFNENPTYLIQFLLLILLMIGTYHYFKSNVPIRKKIIYWIITFVPTFGMIISFHFISLLYTLNDFPRTSSLVFAYPLETILKSYFYPYVDIIRPFNNPEGVSGGSCTLSTHENALYVGIFAIPFLLASFYRRIKWWHLLTFILILCSIGNNSYLMPMYWIQKLPTYDSLGCFNRIRMITGIFIAICIVDGANILFRKLKEKILIRHVLTVLLVLIAFERLIIGHFIMLDTHKKYDEIDSLYRVHYDYKDNTDFINLSNISPYEGTLNNVGFLRGGGDSHLPMDYGKTSDGVHLGTIGYDEIEYLGEFFQNKKNIKPDYWSPNLIKFSDLNPNSHLIVNMNLSKFWYNNGKKLFPNNRIVEVKKKFLVLPDDNGNIVLSYVYPGKKVGLTLTILFVLLFSITFLFNKRYNN